jgi:hypothetical protein
MGLIVDKIKPGGIATSNDGKTARRFFKDTASSRITGIEETLINRCYAILHVICLG